MDPPSTNLKLSLQQDAAAEIGYADIADLERHVKIHPETAKDIQNLLSSGRSFTNASTALSGAHAGDASFYPATGAGSSSASTTSMQLGAGATLLNGGHLDSMVQQAPTDDMAQQAVTFTALAGTTGASQQASTPAVVRHVCAVCNQTFGRASDLNRHAAKHDTNARRHDCLIGNCMYRGSEGFYRRDKLLAHQRAVHGYTL
ncbi:hydrolase C26A3.11 [Physcia stellaris]|nr:hydrolase C26A3.11 [Physcia stellaris]